MVGIHVASVILDEGPDKELDYLVPEHLLPSAEIGTRVLVPLRTSLRHGTILHLSKSSQYKQIKPIAEILTQEPLLTKECLDLARWMSEYYATSLHKVIKLMLPMTIRKGMGQKQQSIPSSNQDLLAHANFIRTKRKTLNTEQTCALRAILETIDSGIFSTHLLHGVTGSGKTEVYLQAIEHTLQKEKSVLYLVPEIALTSQTTERLKSRFSDQFVLFHHRLSERAKRDGWHALREGAAKIAIGPRSTLFSPMRNLGLIILDEEHDGAYKQSEKMPCYHARDVAVMRAKLSSSTVVLGSATPSLESYCNALSGKYRLLTMHHRAEASSLPHIDIIDMRKQTSSSLFSDALLDAIAKRFKCGEQILLFLNRRGYHAQRFCQACGNVAKCPHCDAALTYHRNDSLLACHFCTYTLSTLTASCQSCGSSQHFKYKGAGTEQVERALHAIFPELRTLRLDADTTRHKGSHDKILKQFRSGKADLLIGTQMIAKGLHFPSCTLVGVLNAEASLAIPDFRASERTFQILCQVAGRSGRSGLKGTVLLQTWSPESQLIARAAQQDYKNFYEEEIASRKLFGYPPYGRIVKFLGSGHDELLVKKSLTSLRELLVRQLPETFAIDPLVPCGHAKIKDRFRFQFLVRGPSCLTIVRLLASSSVEGSPIHRKLVPKGIHLLIDIDPISTFS